MSLAVRIIPCLDVKDGVVVKGVQFKNHEVVGNIIETAKRYSDEGADELVFYDITASSEDRVVTKEWVQKVADVINIPFCVAGGIRSVDDALAVLNNGADKVSINSPALENPELIEKLAKRVGSQSVVIGIDYKSVAGNFETYMYTGNETKILKAKIDTLSWIKEVTDRGAGEIVLNCMGSDGMREGYDLSSLKEMSSITHLPLVASGGAGSMEHFATLFKEANVNAGLAASVFHKKIFSICELKQYLKQQNINVRL